MALASKEAKRTRAIPVRLRSAGPAHGRPGFKWKDFFIKHRVHLFSSNYALYSDMSVRVMTVLASFTPDIEIYSHDESFLAFSGNARAGLNKGWEMRRDKISPEFTMRWPDIPRVKA